MGVSGFWRRPATSWIRAAAFLLLSGQVFGIYASADTPIDLPSMVIARDVAPEMAGTQDSPTQPSATQPSATQPSATQRRRVRLVVPISSVPQTGASPAAKRWLVQMKPRPGFGTVVDYLPKTSTAASVQGPIEVTTTREQNNAGGLSLDGGYGHLAAAHAGWDHGQKKIQTVNVKRLPRHQAVVSSGTFDRGTGVQFKLDATPQSPLEGERTFELTLEVGPDWVGGMLEIDITAEHPKRAAFPWMEDEVVLRRHSFSLAVADGNNALSVETARRLGEIEAQLWRASVGATGTKAADAKSKTKNRWWHDLFSWSDIRRQAPQSHWLHRLVRGQADPHLDAQIRKQPMPQRLLALEYAEAVERLVGSEPIHYNDRQLVRHQELP
ncbi:MAG: hypothetical protein AAF958_19690 [Planctomycetota bacterium]